MTAELMRWMISGSRAFLVSAAVMTGLGSLASAQNFPSRLITIIVPYPAGGGADPGMRIIAQKASEILGQTIVIDNRGGGTGIVGAVAAKQADPDGYTLFMGHVGSHAVNSSLMKLPYDPIKDFVPVSELFTFQTVLVVPEANPAKSVADLAAQVKARPGQMTYASPGLGSGNHIMGEMFRLAVKAPITHVPYRGVAQAVPDLVAGRTDLMFVSYIAAGPQIQAGKLRPLAVAGKQRLPNLPDTPTMAEAGFPTVAMDVWFGLLAPAGTPAPIVDQLAVAFNKAARDPGVMGTISQQGASVVAGTPAEFTKRIADDTARLGAVIQEAGIKSE